MMMERGKREKKGVKLEKKKKEGREEVGREDGGGREGRRREMGEK